ncbi:MAG TPA: NAD-dependent epimerase/dehydratase family protein [Gemmatimonadaceae bacterium]|nr:NAD-dependent epimerase/dehydratase family protein [Gemmatimonadaceae bacterium]
MRVFVTGAASPLGRALVAALVKRKCVVVGLVRRSSGVTQMRNLGAIPVVGDVRRPAQLNEALQGCELVFHLASFFDFWSSQPDDFHAVNVGGTRSIMWAAAAAGVQRVIHCGSAVTIGAANGEVGDEFTRHRGHTETELERSQLEAERLARSMSTKGVEVVIVNTGLIVAPADPGWTGRLIARAVSGEATLASHAKLSWVWVGDAIEGLLRAAVKRDSGERYILSGDILSSYEVLSRIAGHAHRPAPRALPRPLALTEAAFATALAAPLGRRPRLALDEARFLTSGFRVDGTHAATELKFEYTPASRYLGAVARAYESAMSRFAS